jgi:hypothetical protein
MSHGLKRGFHSAAVFTASGTGVLSDLGESDWTNL